ncbi:hydantoinase/oxoprolinase family protein [Peribacillus frigoritolerans]|uniref:hydantoinase/oxoprolinase family protein n=1 Tax=Peribacillus frigoritolerans TaxID=450367 RepID=UPI0039A3E39A
MRIATDIGGTFTDLVYVDDNGKFGYAKSHTTPPQFENGVIDVIKQSGVSIDGIDMFIHGSTVVINALTERKGVKVGLLTTKGTKDVLEIARGNRPDLYNFKYKKPEAFVERHLRLEVTERLDYKGKVVTSLVQEDIEKAIEYFKEEQVEAIAICFLHSYLNPAHELKALKIVEDLWPEVSVSVSSDITKEWREYERTNTTVLNAYVKPTANSYIDNLSNKLSDFNIKENRYIMQSNGGVTTFENAKNIPINMVESGPVAGIFGAAILGKTIGEENIIAFDIGGTTAKCSLISDGEVKVSTNYYIEKSEKTAGYPIKVPVVDIVEIGNGGGSIAWIDEIGSLKVGPQSAGSLPGPVAYGQGGTLPTTTDANLFVGRLSGKNFDYEVDMERVKAAIDENVAKPFQTSTEEGALGIIDIANSNMLNALKLISVRKGYDPQDFTLLAFGGGGPMHAAELARDLGVKKVVIPLASSVFSAWGMLMTDLRHDYIHTYIKLLNTLDLMEMNLKWEDMEFNSKRQFAKENVDDGKIVFSRFADLRYIGQEHTVKVPVPNGEWNDQVKADIISRFHQMHEQVYSFNLPESAIEIVNLHLTSFGIVDKPVISEMKESESAVEDAKIEERNVFFNQTGWCLTPVYERTKLARGHELIGPAIVEEQSASTVIMEGQKLSVDAFGNLIIETGVK